MNIQVVKHYQSHIKELFQPRDESIITLDSKYYRKHLPLNMQQSIYKYAMDGIEPGHAVKSALSHNFYSLFYFHDSSNLRIIMQLMRNSHLPSKCYGSKKKVREWVKVGGLNGIESSNLVE